MLLTGLVCVNVNHAYISFDTQNKKVAFLTTKMEIIVLLKESHLNFDLVLTEKVKRSSKSNSFTSNADL